MLKAVFIVLFLSAVILLKGNIYGEIKTLTLENVRDLALKNSSSVLQAEKDVKIAQAQLNESYGDFFVPAITASGNYGYTGTGIEVVQFQGQNVSVPNNYPDTYSGSLSLAKPIFDGFKLQNAVSTQRFNLNLAVMKLNDEKNQIELDAETRFYHLSYLEQNIKNSEAADKDLLEQLNYSEQNYKAGNATELDYIKSKLAYTSNKPILIKARHDYNIEKVTLCNELGITNNYNDIAFIGDLMQTTNYLIDSFPEDEYSRLAISNDITLKTIINTLEIARLNKNTQEWARFPILSGNVGYRYDYRPASGSGSGAAAGRTWQPSWDVGLGVSASIDDWIPFSRGANSITEYDENVKKQELARDQQISTVDLQLRTLIMQLKENKETVDSQTDNVVLATESLDMTKKRYLLGDASFLDINDSESSYEQAISAYLLAVYDYYSNYLKLKVMIGKPL